MNTILEDTVKKYLVLGKDVLRAHDYSTTRLKADMMYINQSFRTSLTKAVYNEFQEGEIIPKQEAKDRLNDLYKNLDYNKRAKANDLAEWFTIRNREVSVNGQRRVCIELLDSTYTTID
jgi:chlorite dismutase